MATPRDAPFSPTYMVPKKITALQKTNDPSLPSSKPTTSRSPGDGEYFDQAKKRCIDAIYDKRTGEFLGRTWKSWVCIISYSIMYIIFLATYTLVFLYGSLVIVKATTDYRNVDRMDLLTYPEQGIGLTASPTSVNNYPLIWYKNGDKNDYEKYVQALDKLITTNRRKREVSNLGPCGQSPYGYGDKPCIIVRINKRFRWSGQPLQFNSTIAKSAPPEVQKWMRTDKTKLWLQCSGYHSYDREHIARINYYPDPPGFDAAAFPLDSNKKSPLVAVQIAEFSFGVSLAIQCSLWYEAGPSTVEFVIYVAPGDTVAYAETSVNV